MRTSIHELRKNTVQTTGNFCYCCHFNCLIFETGYRVTPVALKLDVVAKDDSELLILL